MHQKALSLALALALLLALLLAAGCLQPAQKYEHEWQNSGMLFRSNEGEPRVLFREYSIKPRMIVLSELYLEDTNQNPSIYNATVLPSIKVIAGNDRNAVQLIAFMKGPVIQECETNQGDVLTQVSLSGEECRALIEEWSEGLFIIYRMPEPSIEKPYAVLGGDTIEIHTRGIEELPLAAIAVMEQLFPNAQEVLGKTSEKLQELG